MKENDVQDHDSQSGKLSKGCTSSLLAVGDALYVIGGKWKLRIIIALSGGALRFNELQHSIPGLSARILSNNLKELEMNGFIKRTADTGIPVVVQYGLTEYSQTLRSVIRSLSDWGKMHREKIRKE